MTAEARAVLVREAGLDDAPILGRLIDAMDTHYNGAGKTSGAQAAAACARCSLEDREGTRYLVAECDGQPAGVACFAVIRPGHRLQGLVFLKDLFVVPPFRKRGIGGALLRGLSAYALARGIGRIDLTTDVANTGAQRLYEELGASRETILRYRYDEDAMRRLAKQV